MSQSSPDSAGYLLRLFGLEGLSAVVIGGTGALGGAFCDAVAAAGAYTYVVGRNREAGLERVAQIVDQGGRAEFIAADCTCRDDLTALQDHIVGQGRHVDILINAPGINSATPFLEISDDEWSRIVDVNLHSVQIACQIFGKLMLESGKPGSIINIASVSAVVPLSRVFTYSLTKAAIVNLTQNLSREWASRGVRVNALSPGFFPTEQNRKVLTPDRVASVLAHSPIARFGKPEELAGAILLLASPNAGSFLTGANLVVDGGFTSMTI
ncbi:MAG: SDR family oxidoreductase [Planctomycetaceae bacterium]|nr:SDR family oxidoreductase [Planctomycetaceae bacterium]